MPRQKKEEKKDNSEKEVEKSDKTAGSQQPHDDTSRVESRMDEIDQKETESGRDTSAMGTMTPPPALSHQEKEKDVVEKDVMEKEVGGEKV